MMTDLINIARQAWHDADSTGEEDYDKLWEAVVTAVTNSLKPPVIQADTPAGIIRLVWATPDVDQHLGYIARVSNPANQDNPDVARLLRYMAEHGHVSPFEMAAACLEINTTRDIGRQILRHRSFSFQEFCVAGDTQITLELPNGVKKGKRAAYHRTIEHLYNLQQRGAKLPSQVRVYDEDAKQFVTAGIREVFQTGVKPVFRVTLANGKHIDCTREHKFLTSDGFASLEDAIDLRLANSRAAFMKVGVKFACNGVDAYKNYEWLAAAKIRSIKAGIGLAYIAQEAGVTTHTIRKWLKRHGLQFTHAESATYTKIWNRGLRGYNLPKKSAESIERHKASAKRGSESNLWKGGTKRSERLKIADWCATHRTEFMRAVNYQCVRCQSNLNLELHHIETVVDRPDLAYEKSNIQVLCRACHRAHHVTLGHNKTWRSKSRGNTLTTCWSEVVKLEYLGEKMTYDMQVEHQSHNYVANGIVTHNSQRYASASALGDWCVLRECRLQDRKNRQSSLECDDDGLADWWSAAQSKLLMDAKYVYEQALARGVAKEQARAVLPEGMTKTRMYMTGSMRSWAHYLKQRLDPSTQKEHRQVAQAVAQVLQQVAPVTMAAVLS